MRTLASRISAATRYAVCRLRSACRYRHRCPRARRIRQPRAATSTSPSPTRRTVTSFPVRAQPPHKLDRERDLVLGGNPRHVLCFSRARLKNKKPAQGRLLGSTLAVGGQRPATSRVPGDDRTVGRALTGARTRPRSWGAGSWAGRASRRAEVRTARAKTRLPPRPRNIASRRSSDPSGC